jgi:hypothetical protein
MENYSFHKKDKFKQFHKYDFKKDVEINVFRYTYLL